ncbi:hypothetical protein EV126DRAFT_50083 [Verticillium dahliae]|nr:hypothetical protein EV126DRAFT_50083 [Verticillium dahliae]
MARSMVTQQPRSSTLLMSFLISWPVPVLRTIQDACLPCLSRASSVPCQPSEASFMGYPEGRLLTLERSREPLAHYRNCQVHVGQPGQQNHPLHFIVATQKRYFLTNEAWMRTLADAQEDACTGGEREEPFLSVCCSSTDRAAALRTHGVPSRHRPHSEWQTTGEAYRAHVPQGDLPSSWQGLRLVRNE